MHTPTGPLCALKVDLQVSMTRFGGFDPRILASAGMMSAKLRGAANVRRYAVVGAPSWMEGLLKLADPMMPVEIRSFPQADEAAAWDWVKAA